LRARRRAQAETRLLVGTGWVDNGLVFTGPTGGPLNALSVSQRFDRAVAPAAGLRIRFHDLRHSHATHLLGAGVNPKVVSERLGHASVRSRSTSTATSCPASKPTLLAVAALVDIAYEQRYQTATTGADQAPVDALPTLEQRRSERAGGAGLEPATSGSKVRCSAS